MRIEVLESIRKNQDVSDSDKVTDRLDLDKSFAATSSVPESSKEPQMIDYADGLINDHAPKLYCPATKRLEINEDDDDLYGDFDLDEMDINMENIRALDNHLFTATTQTLSL